MPRLKKYTVDVSSRRFVEDRVTARASATPVFYAGETQDIEINLIERLPNRTRDVITASNGTLKARLGTSTTLIGSSTTFTYDAPAVVQAAGSVTTASPITIALQASWVSVPTEAPQVEVKPGAFIPIRANVAYDNATAVTATFRSFLQGAATFPAVTATVSTEEADAFAFPGLGILVEAGTVTFSSTLNNVQAATFTVTTTGSSVTAIAINTAGTGYPDGTYDLTITGGTVTTAAQATCVASGGAIVSVTIVTGGSGYVTAPAATLFTPAKSLLRVTPNDVEATVNGRPRFYWHHPLPTLTTVTLNVGAPDNTSTPPTVVSPVVLAQYLETTGENLALWEINVVSAGYGYTTAPAVTVPPISVSSRRRTTVATLSGNNLSVAVNFSNAVTASAEEGSLFAGGRPYVGVVVMQQRLNSGFENFTHRFIANGELSAGTYTVVTNRLTSDTTGSSVLLPWQAKNRSRHYYYSGADFDLPPVPTSELGVNGYASGADFWNTNLDGLIQKTGPGLTRSREVYDALYGRSILCAVVPVWIRRLDNPNSDYYNTIVSQFNEAEPERYAVVRVTFPPLRRSVPDYYVGYQAFSSNQFIAPAHFDDPTQGEIEYHMGNQDFYAKCSAPGGGFWEPTIEFLDYGKGYKSKLDGVQKIYKLAGYHLRPLSSLPPGARILATVPTRSVTAATSGLTNYYPTLFSNTASVTSQPSGTGLEYIVSGSNFGYNGFGQFTVATGTVATGAVARVVLSNRPKGYNDGVYPLTFTGGSPAVTATGQMVVQTFIPRDPLGRALFTDTRYSVVVCSSGSGYTSAPTVTVQGPQALTASTVTFNPAAGGSVAMVSFVPANLGSLGDFSGYRLVNPREPDETFRYPLTFSASPVSGGTAEGYAIRRRTKADALRTLSEAMSEAEQRRLIAEETRHLRSDGDRARAYAARQALERPQVEFVITNTGYGYVTPPSVTLAAPDMAGYRLASVGFASGFGNPAALGDESQQNAFNYEYWRQRGYVIQSRSTPSLGLPYGEYPVGISEQPGLSGAAADIRIVVTSGEYSRALSATSVATWPGPDVVIVAHSTANPGEGYAAIPTLSVPTSSGFILAGVTLSAEGYNYNLTDVPTIVDPTGTGARVEITEVAAGKIKAIKLVSAGRGYSAAPVLAFPPPRPDDIDELSENGMRFTLTVATIPAASVLKNADEATVNLEIYEENPTEQAVVAQIPVRLAKRVKES